MIIVAGGDSMVWGSELADCLHCGPNGHSRKTFPALLTQEYEYQCTAFPGNGNDSITRKVMIACEQNKGKSQAALITWTFHSRYEFRFENDNNPRWEVINSWTIGNQYTNESESEKNKLVAEYNKKAEHLGITDFAKSYFNAVGFSGYWQIYTALKEIVALQNYLKVNNIPYLFTCVDNGIIDNFWIGKFDETITCLYNQLEFDNWYLFPAGTKPGDTLKPRGFYQWALENKYSIAPHGHPLEQAHADAAELIREKFNELVKKSI